MVPRRSQSASIIWAEISNAATAKQYTCYYGHCFEQDVAPSLNLLSDMVTGARLDAGDMEMERG